MNQIKKLKLWIESNEKDLYDFGGSPIGAIRTSALLDYLYSLPSAPEDRGLGAEITKSCKDFADEFAINYRGKWKNRLPKDAETIIQIVDAFAEGVSVRINKLLSSPPPPNRVGMRIRKYD